MNTFCDGKRSVVEVVNGKPPVLELVVSPSAVDVVDGEPVVNTDGGMPVDAVPGFEGKAPQAGRSKPTRRSPAAAKNAIFVPDTAVGCTSLATGHSSELLDEGILLSFRTAPRFIICPGAEKLTSACGEV